MIRLKTKELSVNKQHYLPSISKHLTYEVVDKKLEQSHKTKELSVNKQH
jgi:hypothetical protein